MVGVATHKFFIDGTVASVGKQRKTNEKAAELQISSGQDGFYALGKAHNMRSTPSLTLRSFPSVTCETVPMFA